MNILRSTSNSSWPIPAGGIYSWLVRLLPLGVLLLGLAITYSLWLKFTNNAHHELEIQFDLEVSEVQLLIQQRLLAQEEVLNGVAGLFAASSSVERDEFRTYVKALQLEANYPGILGVGYTSIIQPRDLQRHISIIRQEGFPYYAIRPADKRDFYTSIIYLEPFDWRNQRAFGYDMFSEPVRRAAMEQARDSGKVSISGKVKLVQETRFQPQPGFVMFVPVYRNGSASDTLAARRSNLIGWVYSPLRTYDLMTRTLEQANRFLDIHIYDGKSPSQENLLFTSHGANVEPQHQPLLKANRHITVNGHPWLVQISSLPSFEATQRHETPRIIAATGIALSTLLGMLTWLLVFGRERAIQGAAKMTAELAASEARWKFALEGSGQGVWDWDIPAHQVFFSPLWKSMLGYSEEDIGTDLSEWESRVHPEDMPQVMADVQAYFSGSSSIYINVHRVLCKDGSYKWILDRGIAVSRDRNNKPLRMIGTHTDITLSREAERRLQESEARLQAILDNSPFLIWLKDREGRYLAGNKTWFATLGLSDMNAALGKTDFDFSPTELAEKYRADDAKVMASRRQISTEEKIIDSSGREFWSETHKTPIIDQDGNVLGTTGFARDITEKRQFEIALRNSEENLRVLFENSPVGTTAVDPETGFILRANQKFLEMFGYTQEELSQMTVWDITYRDDTHITDDTMQTLASGESSTHEAEKRYVRKDGSVFWGRVSVTTLKDIHGKAYWNIGAVIDINLRKAAEQKIRETAAYTRSLIEASPDPLVTLDEKGNITDLNLATEHATGRSREELIGTRLSDSFTDPAKAQLVFQQVFTHGFVVDYPLTLSHVNGHRTDVMYNASLYRDENAAIKGVFVAARDISQQKLIEDALRENQERLLMMLENSPMAVRIAGANGSKVYFANQSYAELIGVERDHVIGKNPVDYYPKPQDYIDILDTLNRGETITNRLVELRIPTRNNVSIWALASYMLIDYQGEPAVLGWFYDVSELSRAKQLAEDAARVKAEFLANMSHEIRTPMNAVIGLSQLAMNRAMSPDIRDYLEKIHSASTSLLSILNDILDLSKTESGHMTIDHSDFDLDTVLENVHNLFSARAQDKFLDFEVSIGNDVPRELIGDALRLQQILTNLLGNAIKFTERGKVTLAVTLQHQTKHRAMLQFSVSDTGIGIAADDLPKLFQPFTQVDGSSTRRFGGTGLGLAISNNLLRLMNSGFEVSSSPGKGTTFSFALELELSSHKKHHAPQPDHPQQNGNLTSELAQLGAPLAGSQILLAEDHEINQQVIREFLKLAGISVLTADNGEIALQLLERHHFDAVLMDVHMPVMGGIEATLAIRHNPEFASLPILALTAGVTADERAKCLNSGMNDFISKPVEPHELISTLLRWIDPGTRENKNTAHTEQQPALATTSTTNPPTENVTPLLASKLLSAIEAYDFTSALELIRKIKTVALAMDARDIYAAADSLEDECHIQQCSKTTLGKLTGLLTQHAAAFMAAHNGEQ